MVFPTFHIEEIKQQEERDLTRFDLDFDLPDHFLSRRLRSESRTLGPMSLRDLEMKAIHDALDRHDGNKPQAAEELGISLKTLYNKLNQNSAQEKAA